MNDAALVRRLQEFSDDSWATSNCLPPKEASEIEWILWHLEHGTVHDPDYKLFTSLLVSAERALIIDVGANYGYSITSLINCGYHGRILSFEPLKLHEPALRALHDRMPETVRFRIAALSDAHGWIDLVIPLLRGVALTALTFSPQDPPSLTSLAISIQEASVALQGTRRVQHGDVCIARTRVMSVRLSTQLDHDPWFFEADAVGLKVDVEGQEWRVLEGLDEAATNKLHVLLIEGGAHHPRVRSWLENHHMIEVTESGLRLRTGVHVRKDVSPNGLFLPEYLVL